MCLTNTWDNFYDLEKLLEGCRFKLGEVRRGDKGPRRDRHTADTAALEKGRSSDVPFWALGLVVLAFSPTGFRTPGSGRERARSPPWHKLVFWAAVG